ncbi:MAG: DUF4253 domain-containing protein [Lachnospiraceae bacterium]|jgi:hypothetical protein|nr:DUF4253 domain-containing protein [Lachnospiraceae bacterium]MCI8826929.1 DUF4253 domain-containing protein [Lachnospiraceae bacterium]
MCKKELPDGKSVLENGKSNIKNTSKMRIGMMSMMTISKYWYETYGAVLATISHDVLEYILPEPINKEDTKTLAWDMVAFCSDVVAQGDLDIRIFANSLAESTAWYFWWD